MSIKASNASRVCTAIGLAAISLLASSAQAHNGEGLVPRQKAVEYGDLDLSVAGNADQLYERLRTAAKEVCDSNSKLLHQLQRERKCYRQALCSAVAAVNHATLTNLYRSDKSRRLVLRRTDDTPHG